MTPESGTDHIVDHADNSAYSTISELPTPFATLTANRVRHNIAVVHDWARLHSFTLRPHGKTTMCPTIWQTQLAAGAAGITVATIQQAQVALRHNVPHVQIANPVIDHAALRILRHAAAHHTYPRVTIWIDSLAGVHAAARALHGVPVEVLIDMGVPAGRTGTRTIDQAVTIARAARAAGLRVAGVAGYEGAVAHDRHPNSLRRVRDYLHSARRLYERLDTAELLDRGDRPPRLSLAGSIYADLISDEFSPRRNPHATAIPVELRPGAYVAHDDDYYRANSPFGTRIPGPTLTAALHVWARVISTPEPGMVILNAGKRNLPTDLGTPLLQSSTAGPIDDRTAVIDINDQHLIVRCPPRDPALSLGSLIRLGISHPCTAFDRWRRLVVIDDIDAPRDPAGPTVQHYVTTEFA